MISQASTRNIIVTGANKGLGYALIESLLKESTPYNIILTARSIENSQKALETLKKSYPQATSKLSFKQLDLDANQSQDAFVEWVKNELKTIDILVNNAGIMSRTPNGKESAAIMHTNFIQTVRLTNKLLPFLVADGKIITLSSTLGSLSFHGKKATDLLDNPITEEKLLEIAGKLNENYLKDVMENEFELQVTAYHISKALLNAWTRWTLSQKIKGEQQSYTVCPGWCKTDLGGSDAFFPVEHGIVTTSYLIKLPFSAKNALNNKFVRDEAEISWADRAYGPN